MRAYSESAIKPKGSEREGGEPDGRKLDEFGAGRDGGDDKPSPPDKKVEIF